MGLDGIAISGRGALALAFKLEALIAKNGQRVGEQVGQYSSENGQLAGLGKFGKFSEGNGQLVGVDFESVARLAGRANDLDGARMQQGAASPVLETAAMLQALRALEANLQALRIQDATLERTVNELARPAK
jgi:hypothetical protein